MKKPKHERHFRYPCFKKKTQDRGFALWNDQFRVEGKRVRIAKLGWVRMREELRFDGKNLGARVRFRAGRWFISIQVEMPDAVPEARTGIVGVDLGIKVLMTCSDGTIIANCAPRRRLLKRQKKLQHRDCTATQKQSPSGVARGASRSAALPDLLHSPGCRA